MRQSTEDVSLRHFLDTYYAFNPVNATFTGIEEYDGVLPDWSPEGTIERATSLETVRYELVTADTDPTGETELAIQYIDVQLAELTSGHFFQSNPSLHVGEAVFGVVGLLLREHVSAQDRVEPITQRLAQWPRFFAHARMALAEHAIPELWRTRAIRECQGAQLLLERGLPLWSKSSNLDANRAEKLTRAGAQALSGLQDFRHWLVGHTGTHLTRACGPELFDTLLRAGHQCTESRETLARLARESLTDARSRLSKMIQSSGFRDFDEVNGQLSDLHPTQDEYALTFSRLWDDCRHLTIHNDLLTWPDFPLRYRPIPQWAVDAAPYLYFLFYRSPAPFNGAPVAEYMTPNLGATPEDVAQRLRNVNSSVIKLNHVVHHGAVGHHVQNYYAYNSDSTLARIGAVDCASRIAFFGAGTMAEGWACYATDLMEEFGFLSDQESIALQENRVKQLVRAVVDLELHDGSLDTAQALQLFSTKAGMDQAAAEREVTKLSMFPGTGLMYWYGTKQIWEAREDERNRLGSAFSLRQFHDRLLQHGSIPVPLIRKRMNQDS